MRRVCTSAIQIWGANFWKWIHSCNLGGFVWYAESQLQSVAWKSLKICGFRCSLLWLFSIKLSTAELPRTPDMHQARCHKLQSQGSKAARRHANSQFLPCLVPPDVVAWQQRMTQICISTRNRTVAQAVAFRRLTLPTLEQASRNYDHKILLDILDTLILWCKQPRNSLCWVCCAGATTGAGAVTTGAFSISVSSLGFTFKSDQFKRRCKSRQTKEGWSYLYKDNASVSCNFALWLTTHTHQLANL